MAISQTIGIDMPNDFPTTAHDAVNTKLGPCRARAPAMWAEYAGGWNAIAIRFRTAADADGSFTASIRAAVPSLDEYQVQEQALFAFFVTGYAAIESFSYALFALGALLQPTDFPMCTQKDFKNIYPAFTAKKFATHFVGASAQAALSGLVNDNMYVQWGLIRNVLAHRAAPPRLYEVSIHERTSGQNTSTSSTVWQIVGGLVLNETTTSLWRAWLATQLAVCVQATESFVNAKFP